MRSLVYSAMKDEGPDVLEWACYHRLIGFNEVLIYTNDCVDGSDNLLDALQDIGLLQHRRHSIAGKNLPAQEAAATLIQSDHAYLEADWAMWIDADEFVLPIKYPDVQALISALEAVNADAIALPWRNFGTSEHISVPDGLVLESFLMTSRSRKRMERTFKCLFRTGDHIERLYIHKPIWRVGTDIKFLGPDLSPLPKELASQMKPNQRPKELLPKVFNGKNYAARVNHYAVKSYEQFLLKRTRRSGMGNKGRFSDKYLNRFDYNEVKDERSAHLVAGTKSLMSEALSHGIVRNAYAETVRRRSERIAGIDDSLKFWLHQN